MNTHPLSGELNLYGTPEKDHTYGLIAYLPNLTSTGHILIVGGLNTAGAPSSHHLPTHSISHGAAPATCQRGERIVSTIRTSDQRWNFFLQPVRAPDSLRTDRYTRRKPK
jgi:hypothetical protein